MKFKKFVLIFLLLLISIISSNCSSISTIDPKSNITFNEESLEHYTKGGYSYIKAQGHWVDGREAAKRSAERAAQKNYASSRHSVVKGHFKSKENDKGRSHAEAYHHSKVSPTSVRILSTEVIKEETRNENSFVNNQEWRFTVRVKIQNGSNRNVFEQEDSFFRNHDVSQKENHVEISKDGNYYSIPKSSIQATKVNQTSNSKSANDDFSMSDDEFAMNEDWASGPTTRDIRKYTLYGGLTAGAIFIVSNPWLVFFL